MLSTYIKQALFNINIYKLCENQSVGQRYFLGINEKTIMILPFIDDSKFPNTIKKMGYYHIV